MPAELQLTSGTHVFMDSFSQSHTILYLGAEACGEIRMPASDPSEAEPEDVVGYAHGIPADGYYEDTVCDGARLTVDGVPCQVGVHDYQEDGLAVAEIRRAE